MGMSTVLGAMSVITTLIIDDSPIVVIDELGNRSTIVNIEYNAETEDVEVITKKVTAVKAVGSIREVIEHLNSLAVIHGGDTPIVVLSGDRSDGAITKFGYAPDSDTILIFTDIE